MPYDFSALYSTNAGSYTATIQVALNPSHKVGSYEYMDRVRRQIALEYPDLRSFLSSGSMVDSILNIGMPSPIDLQVSGGDLNQVDRIARELADRIRGLPGVGEAYIPQDMN